MPAGSANQAPEPRKFSRELRKGVGLPRPLFDSSFSIFTSLRDALVLAVSFGFPYPLHSLLALLILCSLSPTLSPVSSQPPRSRCLVETSNKLHFRCKTGFTFILALLVFFLRGFSASNLVSSVRGLRRIFSTRGFLE